jgi:hypothetical protein
MTFSKTFLIFTNQVDNLNAIINSPITKEEIEKAMNN